MPIEVTKEQLDLIKASNLFFGLPCYGGMVTEGVMMSMIQWAGIAHQNKLNYTIESLTNESLIPRGRNSLVAKFLANPAKPTHLMFIDSDIVFDPSDILKLIYADKDVIGGLYPKKTLPVQYVYNPLGNSVNKFMDGIVQLTNIGSGFMLIKRDVIQKLIRIYPELHYQDSIGLDLNLAPYKYALFDTHIDKDTNEYLSEDYYFCKLVRSIGLDVWTDTSVKLGHMGYHAFKE